MTDIQRASDRQCPLLARDSVVKAVGAYIKEYITDEHLSPGDSLPSEAQIAERLGVSRGSVREAVKALEALGIVDVSQGRGLFVRDTNLDPLLEILSFGARFEPKLLAELMQLRTWLETAAIGEVIKRMDAAQLQEIEQCLEKWETHARQGIIVSEDDRDFHQVLYRNLGNKTFLQLLDIFWLVFNGITEKGIRADPYPLQTLNEHRTIFEMVRKGDIDGARRAIIQSNRHITERIYKCQERERVGDQGV